MKKNIKIKLISIFALLILLSATAIAVQKEESCGSKKDEKQEVIKQNTNKNQKKTDKNKNSTIKINVPLKKPAIYLYPKQEQEVKITLDEHIQLGTVIPQYVENKGWHIMAHPDGHITDLQPEYTDCNKINSNKFGFEYAKKACEANNYPYIYWDGLQKHNPFTVKQTGWVINKENVEEFLNTRADEIQFNEKEKKEFVRYWKHQLKKEKGKRFHVFFLQNSEVDSYVPIYVTPKPDSSNRVIMVAKNVGVRRLSNIKPQTLVPINRDGFTMVEWGGIILGRRLF